MLKPVLRCSNLVQTGDYQNFDIYCDRYRLIERQLNVGRESRTDTYIIDYSRVNDCTNF